MSGSPAYQCYKIYKETKACAAGRRVNRSWECGTAILLYLVLKSKDKS